MTENEARYFTSSGRPADLSEWEVGAEHVAESLEQGAIIEALLSSLRELIRRRGWTRVLAGGDNYFAWIRERPMVRISPDVYLLDNPPKRLPKMWRTWLPRNPPPRWALEIVSENWRKDYQQVPPKYEELGCRELVIFDPDAAMGHTYLPQRVPLTVFRRSDEGRLVRVYFGAGPAFSPELGIWLVPGREGYAARLRLSEDAEGTQLIPTCAETIEACTETIEACTETIEACTETIAQQAAALEKERAEKAAQAAALEKERAEKAAQAMALKKARAERAAQAAALAEERAERAAQAAALEKERAARKAAERKLAARTPKRPKKKPR